MKWKYLNFSQQAILALEPGIIFTVRIIALFIFTLVFSLLALLNHVLYFLRLAFTIIFVRQGIKHPLNTYVFGSLSHAMRN